MQPLGNNKKEKVTFPKQLTIGGQCRAGKIDEFPSVNKLTTFTFGKPFKLVKHL